MKSEVNKNKLCAIGGFVIGSAALRMLVINGSPVRESILKVDNQETASVRKTFDLSKEILEDPDTSPQNLYEWAYEEPFPQYDLDQTPPSERSLLSTTLQHQARMSATSHSISRRTNLFDPDIDNVGTASEASFRLKLFWKRGYYWQESYKEAFWCMSCGSNGNCKEGELMRLSNCKKKTGIDAKFNLIRERKGVKYQVAGTDLCLERRGRVRIKLKKCRRTNRQIFLGYRPGREFDMRPLTSRRRCLTNHHHPKRGEVVYAETCKTAHRTKTGFWVKY